MGPTTGGLTIAVSGLPGGVTPHVRVTGPSSYSRDVTSSVTLSDLIPGSYQLNAARVDLPGVSYLAAPQVVSVSVAAGEVANATFAYSATAAATLNLKLAGVQLVQSVQRPDNGVPMVAGRDALLRVFVSANQGNTAQPTVRVRLRQGATVVDSFLITAPGASVPQALDTATLTSTWNVVISGNRMVAGIGLTAELDPTDLVAESNESDNRYPVSGTMSLDLRSVPQFNVRFIPVKQSVNGLTGNATAGNAAALIDVTHRMYPLNQMNIEVRPTYTTSAPVLQNDDGNGAWGQILSEMSALKSSDGSAADYVGVVPATYNSGIAGLGYVGYAAAIAWDKNGSAPNVIAHELGHNLGRQHAPCGNPAGPDPSYPYANATIGVWGYDFIAQQLKSPASYKDLMSYCNPTWVSDYTYEAILQFRGTAPAIGGAAGQGGGGAAEATSGVLLWGRVKQGQLILEPAFVVSAPPRMPSRPGIYRLTGTDAGGGALFDFSFDGDLVADLPGGSERHFAFVVPLGSSEISRLSILSLRANGRRTERQTRSRLGQSALAPSARRLRSGEAEVRWDPAYPMALVRDAASGQVLSFARGRLGRIAFPGTALLVDLSDGVRSVSHTVLVAP